MKTSFNIKASRCAALIIGLSGISANASDGTIVFNGNVSAPTCIVNKGENSEVPILPSVNADALAIEGNTGGRTPFILSISGCASGTGQPLTIGVLLEAPSRTGLLDLDTSTADMPAASNVRIRLLNAARLPIDLKQKRPQIARADNTGNVKMIYYTEYYATGKARAGAVNSHLIYSLIYP